MYTDHYYVSCCIIKYHVLLLALKILILLFNFASIQNCAKGYASSIVWVFQYGYHAFTDLYTSSDI